VRPVERIHRLTCPNCGSQKINYERDALLVAEALTVRGGVLALAREPEPVALDDVHLACSACGAELAAVEWSEERPVDVAGAVRGPLHIDFFRFDLSKARASLDDLDGAIWPVNSFADADELNSLFEAAVQSGIIFCPDPSGFIHVYPLSISEPDPMLAVNRSSGPTLLGYSMKLRERDGEGPLEFTLRLLEETTEEANGLLEAAVDASRSSERPR
jgi:hypothetical protein